MDLLLDFAGQFALELFGEALSGVVVFSGRSMRDAFSESGSTGSLFGQRPWWRS
jgi:hypothetical protein